MLDRLQLTSAGWIVRFWSTSVPYCAPSTSWWPACSHSAMPYFITPTSVKSSEFFTIKRELLSTLCADALISLLL